MTPRQKPSDLELEALCVKYTIFLTKNSSEPLFIVHSGEFVINFCRRQKSEDFGISDYH